MAGPEILEACGCVYANFFFYKFGGLNFVFKDYLYIIFFKNFRGLLRMFHLASSRAGPNPSPIFLRDEETLFSSAAFTLLLSSSVSTESRTLNKDFATVEYIQHQENR